MQSISEILREFLENENKEVITIVAHVEQDLIEDVPSGKMTSTFSPQVMKDWNNFVNKVKKFIASKGKIIKHSKSPAKYGLAEYIDFYITDKNGVRKNGIIDLRISDHNPDGVSISTRNKEKNKIDTDNVDLDITISKGSHTKYHTYEDAFAFIQSYIDKNSNSSDSRVSDPKTHTIRSKSKK